MSFDFLILDFFTAPILPLSYERRYPLNSFIFGYGNGFVNNFLSLPIMASKIHVGVIGAGDCSEEIYSLARELGHLIARNDWVLICGGLGGVMEGAAQGCYREGGMTVGILPGSEKDQASPYIKLPIPTGLGEGRNLLVVRASDVVVAVAGGYGTLSEIALALRIGKPVVGLKTWPDIDGIDYVETPEQAIGMVARHLSRLR
jgi:uncharacterized protein (TIGR00725 family)